MRESTREYRDVYVTYSRIFAAKAGDIVVSNINAVHGAVAVISEQMERFTLRTDVEIVRAPDRFEDPRGRDMWRTVTRLLDQQPPATSQP